MAQESDGDFRLRGRELIAEHKCVQIAWDGLIKKLRIAVWRYWISGLLLFISGPAMVVLVIGHLMGHLMGRVVSPWLFVLAFGGLIGSLLILSREETVKNLQRDLRKTRIRAETVGAQLDVWSKEAAQRAERNVRELDELEKKVRSIFEEEI